MKEKRRKRVDRYTRRVKLRMKVEKRSKENKARGDE
jgi:hypothetical protein